MLCNDVVRRMKGTAGRLDGWAGDNSKPSQLRGSMVWPEFCVLLRMRAFGRMVCFDACISMIPKVDGGTRLPWGSRLCVCIRWFIECGPLQGWFRSIEAWHSTAIDIEECLAGEKDVRFFFSDLEKSFDTVGGWGWGWEVGENGAEEASRLCHVVWVHLLGLVGSRMLILSIPQGYSLSMIFLVALYVPW